MTSDETIALARRETDKLLRLLSDPHPGLFTWVLAVNDHVRRVAQIFGYGENPLMVSDHD